ncbi:hypothetical protein FNV43_RR24668 [Rhamnella rubrinervis]|uniref:Uncharacterized protein n=1 Tax=Rhamnella rubrinervis TaxID=2594499 RepID=A0A8K0DN75_9ROSA|nr:hypothetical protein FNV43_RR24668 [Rhamnella rubrinervis]
MFKRGQFTMIPLLDGGHYYITTMRFEQMQADYRHNMYMLYLDQFYMDLEEQQATMMQLGAQGFGRPPVVATKPKEDPMKDIEEGSEEDSKGSDDYVPFSYSPEPVDPKNFDPWDDPPSD